MKKNKIITNLIIYPFIGLFILSIATFGVADYYLPNEISVIEGTPAEISAVQSTPVGENAAVTEKVTAKLFGVIPIKEINVDVLPNIRLKPCGDVFGVKFFTKGIIVIGMSDIESSEGIITPAQLAGLQVKDIITHVAGKEVNTVEDMAKIVEDSKGDKLKVKYLRDGKEYQTTLTPLLSLTDKKYKTGLWVRDSTAGIGTITYFNPANNSFAGLGHGICDVDTGELMPLLRGTVVDIELTDIVKGREGYPGEIKGRFGVVKQGALIGNTEEGVYGILDEAPACGVEEALPVALKHEVKEGEAKIYANLDGQGAKEYTIEIVKIYKNSDKTKNFIISVTDPVLIEKTGGIVQGMSGSPIVQNGKLIGAVTHVLVNNPTRGYGIFIENMLKNMPEILQ